MGQGERAEDLEGGHEHGGEEVDSNETVSALLPRPRPRRATTASDIAHRRSTSMVLFGLVLLTMKQTMPGLDQSGAATSGIFSYHNGAPSSAGRAFSRRGLDDSDTILDGEPSPTDPNIVQLGRIFAWICTVFYLSSRMPQLWKNFTRKSVQGLSILMFFWAAMGNLSYTLSILNSADAVNPETRRKFLLEAVPYVLGSSGTLMFDVSIFCQWLYYTGKLRVLGLRPKRGGHGHHHHHRHHHSRTRGSRSQSGANSMVLSPSGSQSGLYNILVDEEDSDVIEASSAATAVGQTPVSPNPIYDPFEAEELTPTDYLHNSTTPPHHLILHSIPEPGTMSHSENVQEGGVQAVRLASTNRTVDIVTRPDTSVRKEIVLWEDVLMVFPDALYLQHGAKALPFLKGSDFKTYANAIVGAICLR
ncbi:hypothetical protein BGX23_000608, partial [Mortierella sp. AD031]